MPHFEHDPEYSVPPEADDWIAIKKITSRLDVKYIVRSGGWSDTQDLLDSIGAYSIDDIRGLWFDVEEEDAWRFEPEDGIPTGVRTSQFLVIVHGSRYVSTPGNKFTIMVNPRDDTQAWIRADDFESLF